MVMAYIVMAYIAMAYVVMAYIVMAYVVMAYLVKAYVSYGKSRTSRPGPRVASPSWRRPGTSRGRRHRTPGCIHVRSYGRRVVLAPR